MDKAYAHRVGTHLSWLRKQKKLTQEQLAELRDQLASMRSVSICPNCGRTCSREDSFCPGCGTEL